MGGLFNSKLRFRTGWREQFLLALRGSSSPLLDKLARRIATVNVSIERSGLTRCSYTKACLAVCVRLSRSHEGHCGESRCSRGVDLDRDHSGRDRVSTGPRRIAYIDGRNRVVAHCGDHRVFVSSPPLRRAQLHYRGSRSLAA